MLRLNRQVEYALISLQHMRRKSPGELTSSKEISEFYGCPFDGVARVLQRLSHCGILKSEQGTHGGYQIVKDLNRCNLLDLAEAILGPLSIVKCLSESDPSECHLKNKCNIISPIKSLNKKMLNLFSSVPVASLLEGKAYKNPPQQTSANGLK